MKVRELIEKLQQCNPDAKVCVEVWMDPAVNDIREYDLHGEPCVYIGDNLEDFEYELGLCDEENEEE